MIELLGIIGFIVCILIALPATLLAFIHIFTSPIKGIIEIWITLFDKIIDIIESIKNDFRR